MIALFEQAVPATDCVSREVLRHVLCNTAEDFEFPLLDISINSHLAVLKSGSIQECIWQDQLKRNAGIKSVLREITNDGHELLADFIGTCCRDHFEQYMLICTETTFLQGISLLLMATRASSPRSSR